MLPTGLNLVVGGGLSIQHLEKSQQSISVVSSEDLMLTHQALGWEGVADIVVADAILCKRVLWLLETLIGV